MFTKWAFIKPHGLTFFFILLFSDSLDSAPGISKEVHVMPEFWQAWIIIQGIIVRLVSAEPLECFLALVSRKLKRDKVVLCPGWDCRMIIRRSLIVPISAFYD